MAELSSVPSQRTKRFYEMKKLGYTRVEGEQSGVPVVVKKGDSDWQQFLASNKKGVFVPDPNMTNPNGNSRNGLLSSCNPQAKLSGNEAVPTKRTRLINTKVLKRLNDERQLTQGQGYYDVAERICGELEGALVMSGFNLPEYLPSPVAQTLVRVSDKSGLEMIVDVKPMKRLVPQDPEVQDDFAWIEYSGDPDLHPDLETLYHWVEDEAFAWVAFERKTHFVVVPRKLLASHFSKVVQVRPPSETAKEAINRIFMRGDRNDVQFLFPLDHLESHMDFQGQTMHWYKIDPSDFD